MDLDLTPTPSTSSFDSGNETPPPPAQTQSIIPLSITNGEVKKTHRRPPPPPLVFTYRECMKNHAATLGGHAVDGCGEFMLSPYSTNSDPTSLTCAACGCHRNFHRRDPADASPTNVSTPPFLDYRHPAPPRRSSLSPSPPPQQQPYCQLAPHMLMTLSSAVATEEQAHQAAPVTPISGNPIRRKRFRTKFSHEQKEKMQGFSEKLGWKMQGSDRAAVEEFCRGIGVAKGVLKVWMHNNKSSSGKKKMESGGVNINGEMENKINKENEENSNINGGHFQNEINGGGVCFHVSHNCSSRSH